ncbi:MAG: winged helix-turn-helix transcriptional regulator [Spirochaetales bacterium]|nr:winged helix-turn-helix transcriptional regulator [Spirochaetales bacterium]
MNAKEDNPAAGAGPIIDILKALGDETRFSILEILIRHNICAKSIACRLNLSESAVSQHLKVLRECGLVSGEKQGYWVHYTVNYSVISRLIHNLNLLVQTGCPDPGKDSGACPYVE